MSPVNVGTGPILTSNLVHGHAEPETPQVLQNQHRPPVDTTPVPPVEKAVEKPVDKTDAPPVDTPRNVIEFAPRSTGGQPVEKQGRWSVDHVKASVNTYAIRVRWISGRDKGPPTVITRVSDKVFHRIRKGNYEQFKQNIIAIHEEDAGAIRARN